MAAALKPADCSAPAAGPAAAPTPAAAAEQQQDKQQLQPAAAPPAAAAGSAWPAAVIAAARRLRLQRLLSSLDRLWRRLRSWALFLVEELFEEFQPWLKWIIFDAALTLLVGQLVKQFEGLQPVFEAVGWA